MKYVTYFTLLCAVLAFQFLPAQAPNTLWTRTYGGNRNDYGYSVQQTIDGGYILVGQTSSTGTSIGDTWLIKTDESGDILWTRTYVVPAQTGGRSVQQTTDGGYIITGVIDTLGLFQEDLWLVKTDSFGDTIWTKTFGGSGVDGGMSVQQTTDGGYIITGYKTQADADVWLIKTDSLGDTLWTRTFDGGYNDRGFCVSQTNDGGYFIVGINSASSFRAWLIKTDSIGDTVWTKTYSGTAWTAGTSGYQTNDGGFIALASYGVFWLIKSDSYGDTLWTKRYDIYGGDGYSVQQTTDGGFIMTGDTYDSLGSNYDLQLIKSDSMGNLMWSKSIGGDSEDRGKAVQQTTEGGYIITGHTKSFGAGKADVWLIKIAPDPMNLEKTKTINLSKYQIFQNYPNPFNPTTTIEFDLPKTTEVSLKVFNILGEEVTNLVTDRLSAGSYSYDWDASNMASGVYLYRLEAKGYVETKKMILMR